MPSARSPAIEPDSRPSDERLVAGRFALGRCLGQRQGADIHMAMDVETSDTAVLKIVPVEAYTPGALMRLEYEASLLMDLRSEWVAPLVAFGRDEDRSYVAWKYFPGTPLEIRLREGALSLDETIVVARSLLSALRDLHAAQILHRSVRPANLILSEEIDNR